MNKPILNFFQQAAYADLIRANMRDIELRTAAFRELSKEECEALIAEFERRYADVVAAFKRAGDIAARSNNVLLDFKTRLEALPPMPEPTGGPPTDKRLRYSSKTGATWPKPKRSY